MIKLIYVLASLALAGGTGYAGYHQGTKDAQGKCVDYVLGGLLIGLAATSK